MKSFEVRQIVDNEPHKNDLRFSLYNTYTKYRTYIYTDELMRDWGIGEGNQYSNLLIKLEVKNEDRTNATL